MYRAYFTWTFQSYPKVAYEGGASQPNNLPPSKHFLPCGAEEMPAGSGTPPIA